MTKALLYIKSNIRPLLKVNILLFINLVIYDSLLDKVNLLHFLFDLEQHHLITVILMSQQILLASVFFMFVKYKHLIVKTLAFEFMLTEAWDVLQYLYVDDGFTWVSITANIMLFVSWMAFTIWRDYDTPSVTPKKDTIYLISKKPDKIWGFIPSLWYGTSGYSVLCNGVRYGFRDGKYTITDFSEPENDYRHITGSGINLTEEVLQYIHSKRGCKWTLYDNCMTVHLKLKYLDWKSS